MSEFLSKWKWFFQVYFALVLSVVLGVALSVPVLFSRVRMAYQTNHVVREYPADDRALQEWGRAQPEVISFEIQRAEGNELRIRSEAWALKQQPPFQDVVVKMRELGYVIMGMRGGNCGMVSTFPELMGDPQFLASTLAGMQVAFGGIGLFCLWRAKRRGQPLPPLFPGEHGRAVVWGLAGGAGLVAFGTLYSFLLPKVLGHPAPSPWDVAPILPMQAKLVFLVFGAIGAPITEEIFFRGYMFGKFKAQGHVGLGIVVSSFLFGAVHFSDPYNVPAIALYGVFLAWLYHRTRSLLAPIVAHAVNNGVGILWMVFAACR